MTPTAYVIHSSKGRLRIQIHEKKKDASFFASMKKHLKQLGFIDNIIVNDLTGSILMTGKEIDINKIQSYAQKNSLFDIQKKKKENLISFPTLPKPLTKILTEPIDNLNDFIKQTSNNNIDLAGMFFLSLMGVGTFQVIRGNVILPSWHTAFWYSLGIYATLLSKQHT